MKRFVAAVLLAALCRPVGAVEFCVDTPAGLSGALTAAQTEADAVTIRMVQGTYPGSFLFDGIYEAQAPLTITGGYNAGCTSRTAGADSTIIDAQNAGRGLALQGYRSFTVEHLTVRNGQWGTGGALGVLAWNYDGLLEFDVRVHGVIAESSHASYGAGAYVNADLGDASVTDSVFQNNETCCGTSSGFESFGSPGSGLYVRGKSVVVSRSRFSGNSSFDVAGGAFVVGTDSATIENNLFSGNQSQREGGGLVVAQVPSTRTTFRIESGDASIFFSTGSSSDTITSGSPVPLVASGILSGVVAPYNGCYNWLLDVTSPEAPVLTITEVSVGSGPGAEKAVCGIEDQGLDNTQPLGAEMFVRGTISGWAEPAPPYNFVNFGGGVLQAEFTMRGGSRPPVIIGNTFVDNSAGLHGTCVYGCEGGAIWLPGGDDPYLVTNNAFFGNSALDGLGNEIGLATDVELHFTNNALSRTADSFDDPATLDQDNVETSVPQFVDSAGGDFRLRFGSPLREAGSPDGVTAGTDLAGHPRVRGGAPDVGAYEHPGGARRLVVLPEPPNAGLSVFSPVVWSDDTGTFGAAVRGLDVGWPATDFQLHEQWPIAAVRLAFSPLRGEQEITSLYEDPGGMPRVKTLNILTGQPVVDELTQKAAGAFRFFDADWQARDLVNLGDIDGGASQDLGVLAVNRITGEIAVQLRDGEAGAFIRNLFYLNPSWSPRQLLVLEGTDASPSPEVGVLATSGSGQIAVMIKDAGSNAFIKNLFFLNANWSPVQAMSLDDFSGNGVDEVALLAKNVESGQWVIMMKDAATNAFLNNVFPLGANWEVIKFVALPDENSNGAAELAVLGANRATGKLVIQVRDGMSGQFLRNITPLGSNWTPVDMAFVADVGSGVPGLAVLASRNSDARVVIQTLDATSGMLVSNLFAN